MTFDEFEKLDLRIGTVRTATPVPNSEKLLALSIDLGDETRTILSGIAREYPADSLVGRQVVVIANLEPRTLMGIESNGMVLAAHDAEDVPVLLMPEREVPPGVSIT